MLRSRNNSKHGFTAVELVLVIVVLAILVSVTMVQVNKRRQAMLRMESAQNLEDLYALLYRPPSDSNGKRTSGHARWPLLSTIPGQLTPRVREAVAQASGDFTAFISPAHPDVWRMQEDALTNPVTAISDSSYLYLGYMLPNEEAGLAFIDAYKTAIEQRGTPPTDFFLKVRPFDTRTGDDVAELTKLINTSQPLDVAPAIIERVGHLRGGSNVLFTDGHVEFIPYPGKWPMTERFIKALESLDELKESHVDKAEK